MTKQEAIRSMRAGDKVTHTLFTPEEWIATDKNKIVCENGCRMDPHIFWSYRTGEAFDEGWEVYNAINKSKDVKV